VVPCSAPRVSPRLRAAIERVHGDDVRIAEVCRRVGVEADSLGLPRPSYETIRRLVHEMTAGRGEPGTLEVVAGVAIRARPPAALVDHLAGIAVPRR